MYINQGRLNYSFANRALDFDKKIASWRSEGICVPLVWIIFGVIATIGCILLAVFLLSKVQYREEIMRRTGKKYSVPATSTDEALRSGGIGIIICSIGLIPGFFGGAPFAGIAALIRNKVRDSKIASYEALRESFRHQGREALNAEQLRRLLDHAPLLVQIEILKRCVTKEELALFEAKYGRDATLELASRLPQFHEIATLFRGDWKTKLKNFDYRILKDPFKQHVFFHFAHGWEIGKRFLIAKWLFESGVNLFNQKEVERISFPDLATAGELQIGIPLRKNWDRASPFFMHFMCDQKHIEGKSLQTIKEKMKFIFSLMGQVNDTREALIDALFDETEINANRAGLLIVQAIGYLPGFYDQALRWFIRDDEFRKYGIQVA